MAEKNILLLVADDLGKFLSCYGCPTISTKNIDKLAAQGTRFDNAFASTASCSGSRSTIYTGLHTHQNGQYGLANGRFHFTTFDHIETAPRVFNDLGYQTGIIGKVHVGPDLVYPYGVREESGSRNVKHMAERCAEFFESAKGAKRPFFLTAGFIDPHRDLTRAGFGNDSSTGGTDDGGYTPEDVEVPSYLKDLPEVRYELAQYYRSIHRLDQGVGMILDELQRLGLQDDTLVCFVSDNGPPFINSKTTLYDAGVRLPLVMRQSGKKAGVANPNMISYIDLLPTFLDFAGASERKNARIGRSILPILDSEKSIPGWDIVYGSHTFHEVTNYWPTRYVRAPKYKYHRNIAHKLEFPFAADLYGSISFEAIRNSNHPVMIGKRSFKSYLERPPEELYDLEADPDEVNNLAYRPEYEGKVKELRTLCENWQWRTKDPWLMRDNQSIMAVQKHINAGMVMPDRWDMSAEEPAIASAPAFKGFS